MPNIKGRDTDIEKFRKTRNIQRQKNYAKTAKYERRIWTLKEDEEILQRTITDTELSSIIKRSVQSIQSRRYKLNKENES